MTLLAICQHVARITPVAVPTVIVGSSDQTASLLLACAQDEGESLARTFNWLDMVTEHTFSTVAAQADYDLPSDFRNLVNQTLWDRDNFEELRGPLSPQEWQRYKSSVLADSVTTWKRYRIRNVAGAVKFSIDPTPDSVETLVLEYASNAWCKSSGGTLQAEWLADTDTGVLDEYLMRLGIQWRFLKRLGMSYEDERVEYDREVSQAKARDGGAPVLMLSGRRRLQLIGPQNVPDSGFGV